MVGNPPSPRPLHVPSRYESGAIAGCIAGDTVASSMLFFSTKLTIQALVFSSSFVFALRPTTSTKFNRHHIIFIFLPFIKIFFDLTKEN